MSARRRLYKILGISPLKTLLFNFKYFGLRGIVFPVLVYRNFRMQRLCGSVVLSDFRFGCVKLGVPWAELYSQGTRGGWNVKGTVRFEGTCVLATACIVSCEEDAVIVFGDSFQANDGCRFIAVKEITIGPNCLISWDCTFIDGDFHDLKRVSGHISNSPRSIIIGDDCWIGFGSRIMKGAKIKSGSVVASGSLITKTFDEEHILIGGTDRILDRGISWSK